MTANQTRMLSQVLADSAAAPPHVRAFFYDEPRLHAAARVHDHALYAAERDVCAPRAVTSVAGTVLRWHLDRVCYPAEDLPSGELNRSVGHWNPPDQWEVFEVERGEVAIVVTSGVVGQVELVRCGPGQVLCLRPGSWHLTYVLRGPAVVTNLYTQPALAAPAGPAPQEETSKYFTRPAVRVGLRRIGGHTEVFADGPPRSTIWQRGQDRGRILGCAGNFGEILTAPERHDLLVDPWRQCSQPFPTQ